MSEPPLIHRTGAKYREKYVAFSRRTSRLSSRPLISPMCVVSVWFRSIFPSNLCVLISFKRKQQSGASRPFDGQNTFWFNPWGFGGRLDQTGTCITVYMCKITREGVSMMVRVGTQLCCSYSIDGQLPKIRENAL